VADCPESIAAPLLSAAEIVELLGLEPLPEEGGLWTQTYQDSNSTAIYYLLCDGEVSKMHLLPGPEIYHWYLGDPAQLVLLHPDGSHTTPLLGPHLQDDQRPQLLVPGGVWQGSFSLGNYTLLGTTMAPPYRQQDFKLGQRDELISRWPAAKSAILALT